MPEVAIQVEKLREEQSVTPVRDSPLEGHRNGRRERYQFTQKVTPKIKMSQSGDQGKNACGQHNWSKAKEGRV